MNHVLARIALLVNDYDEAIQFYTQVLGFELVEDTTLTPDKRWVIVKPQGEGTCSLLLAKASDDEQKLRVGNQTGGRVFLFLYTDDIDRDYARLQQFGVKILRTPSSEAYGKVLVLEDLYGNKWDLIQPSSL